MVGLYVLGITENKSAAPPPIFETVICAYGDSRPFALKSPHQSITLSTVWVTSLRKTRQLGGAMGPSVFQNLSAAHFASYTQKYRFRQHIRPFARGEDLVTQAPIFVKTNA